MDNKNRICNLDRVREVKMRRMKKDKIKIKIMLMFSYLTRTIRMKRRPSMM